MSRNAISASAPVEAVFEVLDDPYAYPGWVVGARRIRHVDPHWPAVGSRFHHALGSAAGELHDSSEVLERVSPEHIVLEVRFRPTGVARVAIDVTSDRDQSVITLSETPTSGPFACLPRLVTDPVLAVRNALSLRRLRQVVERRARTVAR